MGVTRIFASRKSFLLLAAPLLLSVGTARAASFDGWYGGLGAGAGWADSRVTSTNSITHTQTLKDTGALIGGTLGVNFQTAPNWVWGVAQPPSPLTHEKRQPPECRKIDLDDLQQRTARGPSRRRAYRVRAENHVLVREASGFGSATRHDPGEAHDVALRTTESLGPKAFQSSLAQGWQPRT